MIEKQHVDQIYREIVSVHSSSYCLATNIIRNVDDDSAGIISDDIIFRFDKHIDASDHNIISKLKREIFNQILFL